MKKDYRKNLANGDVIIAKVRFNDECGNGHNTLSVTGELYNSAHFCGEPSVENSKGKKRWLGSCGCIHEELIEHFPDLREAILFHGCTTDGPLYYLENTLYHALQHGPTHAWVYYLGKRASDPLGLGDYDEKKRLLGYFTEFDAKKAIGAPGYSVEWDQKTAKERNLDHARSTAIWPEATDEELSVPREELKCALVNRLLPLMERFKKCVESLGFTYTETPIREDK